MNDKTEEMLVKVQMLHQALNTHPGLLLTKENDLHRIVNELARNCKELDKIPSLTLSQVPDSNLIAKYF